MDMRGKNGNNQTRAKKPDADGTAADGVAAPAGTPPMVEPSGPVPSEDIVSDAEAADEPVPAQPVETGKAESRSEGHDADVIRSAPEESAAGDTRPEAPEPAPTEAEAEGGAHTEAGEPSKEISRLDALLARITGKTPPSPSNDNESAVAGHPVATDNNPAGIADGIGSDAGDPPRALVPVQRFPPRSEPDDGGGAEHWPEGWGPPSETNVMRVLGELMAEIDPQRPDHDGKAAGPAGPPAPAPHEPGHGAVRRRRVTGDDAGRLPGPAVAPPRPILGVPPTRGWREEPDTTPPAQWRPVPQEDPRAQVPVGPAQKQPSERRPDQTARRAGPSRRRAGARAAEPPAAPGGSEAPATPARQPAPEPAPWMLEQPEFRRAFGTVFANGPSGVSVADDGESLARRRRLAGWLATAVTVAVVFVLAIFAGFFLYEVENGDERAAIARELRASTTPGQSAGPAPSTRPAASPGATASPEATTSPEVAARPAEPPLPAPVSPRDAETSRVVQPVATGSVDAGAGAFSTFSRPSIPARAGAAPAGEEIPPITIERTAVRPLAEGGAAALSVSRFDGLNVQAAKLIAAYEIDKAEGIVDDILERDPDHFGALLNRGRMGLLRDRFEAAEADFTRAGEIKPRSLAATLGRAEALLGQRRGADALAVIEQAITDNPGEAAAYDLRARAHALTGAVDQIPTDCAELSWKTGLTFVGKWCEAIAYKDAGRTAASEEAFRSAISGGSEDFIRHRQRYLQFRGHYTGEIDGQTGPATDIALAACAADPNC